MVKKKGKGKKKKVVEIDPNALTEVDKTFYELTITDLNRKLARLRSLTQELEVKNEELQQSQQKLDEDRSDVIIYLKRMLQEKTDEIAELEDRISALKETRQEETQKFEVKIAEMEQEYKQMHEQLTSENKLLEGKLNSLEEFRSQRDDLMKKFEAQEELMDAQEKKHKREMYEIERKFIIDKDKLKKDMEARLMQLSTEFHDATELRIAATTHRVIRENIAVNNELDVLLTSQHQLYNENLSIKKKDVTLKQQAELHETEKKRALAKVKVQVRLIEKLTDDHKFLKRELDRHKKYEEEFRGSRREIAVLTSTIADLELKKKILEQNLHNVRCDRNSIKTDFLYLKEENERLNEVLMEAVSCIKEALTVRTDSDMSIKVTRRENLLNSLFNLLSKAKDEKVRRPSMDTVDSVDATYARGDLGFVPKVVELRSVAPTKRNMESQTAESFDEYLKYGVIAPWKPIYSESSKTTSEAVETVEEIEEEEDGGDSVTFFDSTEIEEEETEEEDGEARREEADQMEIASAMSFARSRTLIEQGKQPDDQP